MLSVHGHSLLGHTAYTDLLRLLKDAEAGELRGTVERKTVGGGVYLYDRYRLGERVVSRYIGPATPELEARVARAEEIRAGDRDNRAQRARLVRLLRAEGYQGLDAGMGSLLAALARIGAFRLGGTLVGTVAFRLYEGELGLRVGTEALAQTGDIDVASFERLSLALEDRVTEPVAQALAELSFAPVPARDGRSTWCWRDGAGTLVEFLAPAFGEEGVRRLPALGVDAQGLHYLNFLLREPIKAAALYRSGLLVQVPDPVRYAVHKLIVADRRRDGPDSLKAEKDRRQAALLIEALARDRPDELLLAYEEARAEGPRWRERLDRTLGRMPETAARLEALG